MASPEPVGAGLAAAPRDAPRRDVAFRRGPWRALHASPTWHQHLPLLAAAADPLPGDGAWSAAVLARRGCLRAALGRGRSASACAAAAAIAGLGEGSTPAGDDYLMGALHALWASGPAGVAMAPALAAAATPRTTTYSAAWLERAGRGETGPEWRALLAALPSPADAPLRAAVAAVRSLGHTSGAWSLRGFADTLEVLPT